MNKKNIKLIATDLDGTFLNESKKITKTNKNIINFLIKNGIEFVVASGRDYTSIIDLTEDINKINYYICLNGAKIYKNNKIIYKETIDKHICLEILKKAVKMNINYSGTAGKDICFSQLDTEYYKEFYLEKRNFNFISNENKDKIVVRDFEKMVFFGEVEKLAPLRIFIEKNFSNYVNVFMSGEKVMDVININSNKGKALKFIANDQNISLENIISFGDNENDLDMLKEAGISVAVKNARDIVKKYAKEETDSNEYDGVGIFLKKYFEL